MTMEPAPVGTAPVEPANPVAIRTRRSNRFLDVALALAAVLAIGAVAFAAGRMIAIDGTVTAVDADSITLKLADGQEMTFKLDDATTYHEAADASSSDVAVGDDVSVKVTGGRIVSGDGGGETPEMSARDVTVSR